MVIAGWVRFDILYQHSYHQGSAVSVIKTQEAEVIITNNYKSIPDPKIIETENLQILFKILKTP